MVQIRRSHPIDPQQSVDLEHWLDGLSIELNPTDRERLSKAYHLGLQTLEDKPLNPNPYAWSDDYDPLMVGLEMANILADLHPDIETLIAAVLYRLVREERLSLECVEEAFGAQVSALLANVLSMALIHLVKDYDRRVLGQTESQSDAVRKMLVAMLDDVRVVLLKLAERCCALRLTKDMPEHNIKLALEAVQIYIPLAHRLGIGQIKWELEDSAFRYLEPKAYKHIAAQLAEKRLDRQSYVENVVELIKNELDSVSIAGQVTGRAKHIFSIWKKMQRKNIGFAEVYDIRAVRVLVPEVRDCYTVLGLLHTKWGNISSEFDDYIARPKDNGYRSLHTAVVAPEGKVLEVQIRTFDMHKEAEMGVCAHWVYKGVDSKTASSSYEEKLKWFRRAIDSYDYEEALNVFSDGLKAGLKNKRIYTFTPDGHVIELNTGATPLDFAYHVHTEVGHGCRGAKVNGRIVPLSYLLSTGDQVEIIVEKNGEPNNEWLRSDLNYLATPRAQLKIRAWFRARDREQRIVTGRQIIEREFKRLALADINYKKLARALNFKHFDDLFAAVGTGDMGPQQVLQEAQRLSDKTSIQQKELLPVVRPQTSSSNAMQFRIHGVGNLMTTIAACCKPLPGDGIRGYVTQGRGVSIHREDCQQLLQMQNNEPQRILDVDWWIDKQDTFAVDVFIEAYDRTGLIRDVSTLLANERINVTSMQSQALQLEGVVRLSLTLEVASLERLSSVLARLNRLPNVIQVMRAKA